VVTFDAAVSGTSAAAWAADARMSALPGLDLDGLDRLIVTAAHPDDETLGAAGLIAEAARRGVPVTVVVVTDGAASHPLSPTTTPAGLRTVREAEAREAVRRLAPGAVVHTLGFADGRVSEQRDAIHSALAELVDESPGRTLLAAPWRGDGHGDHEELGGICADIAVSSGAELLEYPVWMWHWAEPSDAVVPWHDLVALALPEASTAAKRHALSAYTSQLQPLSDQPGDEAMLRPDFLEHFDGRSEVFVRSVPVELGRDYFDAMYARDGDPWGFTSRWYEERKRAATLAALPAQRYGRVLELGCSIGVLTEQLAARSDDLLALDVSAAAVASARERLADQPQVSIEQADASGGLPEGPFDLVVLSEVGYYFDNSALLELLDRVSASLAPDGTVLACHWRHPVADYAQTGDAVQASVASRLGLTRLVRHEEADFLLEVFSADGRSVAARTGLL
jgi:LmbE family N-acetylglucosaminyl deacetylase/SAM-dependent methyltransferase